MKERKNSARCVINDWTRGLQGAQSLRRRSGKRRAAAGGGGVAGTSSEV